MQFICKLDRELYSVVELFGKFFAEMIRDPDYILEANKPNTAIVLKEVEFDGRKLKLILRLKTSADPAEYKTSIITFQHISDKRYARYIHNANILYRKTS